MPTGESMTRPGAGRVITDVFFWVLMSNFFPDQSHRLEAKRVGLHRKAGAAELCTKLRSALQKKFLIR